MHGLLHVSLPALASSPLTCRRSSLPSRVTAGGRLPSPRSGGERSVPPSGRERLSCQGGRESLTKAKMRATDAFLLKLLLLSGRQALTRPHVITERRTNAGLLVSGFARWSVSGSGT